MSRKSPTPPQQKWLTGMRARIAGDLARAEQGASEWEWHARKAEQKLAAERRQHELFLAHVAQLRAKLSAMDGAIRLCKETLDPSTIAAVKAWAGKYGKRGAIKAALQQILERAAPDFVSTTALYEELASHLGLLHATWKERKTWIDRTLLSQMQKWRAAGAVERGVRRSLKSQNEACWRWKQTKRATMAELRARDAEARDRRNANA